MKAAKSIEPHERRRAWQLDQAMWMPWYGFGTPREKDAITANDLLRQRMR